MVLTLKHISEMVQLYKNSRKARDKTVLHLNNILRSTSKLTIQTVSWNIVRKLEKEYEKMRLPI